MPTYEYACKSCGERLEVVQSFTDDPLTTCPECEGPLRKVFGSIGITFKGSGFYKTDSRATSSAGPKPDKVDAKSSSSEGGSSSSDGGSKSDSSSKSDGGSKSEGSSGGSKSSDGGPKASDKTGSKPVAAAT